MDTDSVVILVVSAPALVLSVVAILLQHGHGVRADSYSEPRACGRGAPAGPSLSSAPPCPEHTDEGRALSERTLQDRTLSAPSATASPRSSYRPHAEGRTSSASARPWASVPSARRLARSARREGLVKILAYRDSGARWSATYLCGRLSVRIGRSLLAHAQRLELERGLPGAHSAGANRRLWDAWDWSDGGEEWTPSPAWKQSLIDQVIVPNTRRAPVTLEIGPGGGRWSEVLQRSSSRLILIDVSRTAIAACEERFRSETNVEYHITSGSSLSPVADGTVDFVFSFDTFVHVAPTDARQYVSEIARVLRAGGRAVIHHAGEGGTAGGWRSNMTASLLADFVAENGLELCAQFDCWGRERRFCLPDEGDILTVFARPEHAKLR